jgi:peptide/nickel transport system permease protein
MTAYFLRRLLMLVPIVIIVSFGVASLMRLVHGDPASLALGEGASDADRAAFNQAYHLDDPLPVQYVRWWGDVFQGNLGTSVVSRTNVTEELQRRLPVTIELLVLATLMTAVIGIAFGVVSALKQNSPVDYSVRMFSMLGLSIPSFWLGTLALVMPAIWWGYLPPLQKISLMTDPIRNLQQYWLPALTMAVGSSAIVMRIARSSVLEVMRNDYIRTARAKGLRSKVILWRHALKNAIIPVITLLGLQVAALIGGTVIIESIFNLQGLGTFLINSIQARDYPSVQGLVLFFAVTTIVVNLLVDMSYALFDPRIRYS